MWFAVPDDNPYRATSMKESRVLATVFDEQKWHFAGSENADN